MNEAGLYADVRLRSTRTKIRRNSREKRKRQYVGSVGGQRKKEELKCNYDNKSKRSRFYNG
jgi:hypothetical protein